jgi:hypothetical protein
MTDHRHAHEQCDASPAEAEIRVPLDWGSKGRDGVTDTRDRQQQHPHPNLEALKSRTRTTPVVFLHVADPVIYGFVSNLARPEGNVTGITNIVRIDRRKVAAVA